MYSLLRHGLQIQSVRWICQSEYLQISIIKIGAKYLHHYGGINMRLDEILAKPISSSVSYDPEAKKLNLKGSEPRMTLKVISRIKHIRKLHDRKQEKRVKFLGAL